MRKAIVVCGVLAIVSVAQAAPIVVFQDDFESYADTAALMSPGAWGDLGATNGTLLPAPYGNPGQGIFNGGGPDAIHVFPDTPVITDANPLVVEYDYWDYSTGTADRNTLGIRNKDGTGLGGFFEIGEYNAMDPDINTPGSTSVQGYGFRTVFVGGPSELQGWVALTQDKVLGKWHHFKLVIGETFCTASVDVTQLDDSVINYSMTVPLTAGAGKKYNSVRFGGPSGVSSTGSAGGDNVKIQIIPEPATLAFLGLGSLLAIRRRRAA